MLGMPLVFGSLLSLRYPEEGGCDRNRLVRETSVQDREHAGEVPDLAPARRQLPARANLNAATGSMPARGTFGSGATSDWLNPG